MALATRCPHCNTTFRVAHDQLKLRAGLVRCGACKEIFNGIEHLLPQDAPAPAPAPAVPPAASAASTPSAPQAPSAPPPPEPQRAAAPGKEAEITTEPEPEAAEATEPVASETDTGSAQEFAAEEDAAPAPPAIAEPSVAATEMETETKADPDEIPDFAEFLQLAEAAADDTTTEAAPKEATPKEETPEDTNTVPPPAAGHDETETVEPPHGANFDEDPLTRMTLMDFHDRQEMPPEAFPHTQPAGDEVDSIEKTIDELRSRPDRRKPLARRPRNMQAREQAEDEQIDAIEAVEEAADISVADEVEEPSFVRKARRRERFGPLVAWTLGIGSVLLTFALAGQGIYTFRNQLAARLPKAKPMLINACAYLGCRVSLPMQIDTISIEANELQSTGAGKDIFVLTTVLRNRSSLTQAWPNLELTLKDTNGKPLVRRVFLPRDYLLDPQDVDRGFAPATEQQLKLVFSLAQPDSSGYEVAIFYP
jgi:predicted Zn finger-like uncharacterized protein